MQIRQDFNTTWDNKQSGLVSEKENDRAFLRHLEYHYNCVYRPQSARIVSIQIDSKQRHHTVS